MAEILLLLGAGLCLLSVPAAVVALLQNRPPRGAAILFVAGTAILALDAWLNPGSVGMPQLQSALDSLFR
ncbi:MAG: hypothetical protein DI616_00855 [Paracoccus denitrificans]|uniref:Uncharacterized protein n=1 Tax=Paracoccus denitrificans TaxID=266 RepID=A0A533IDM1_PARDE|nr:MAG: hypothetical protein DI616_00855 [Paracoccus denitrificans]